MKYIYKPKRVDMLASEGRAKKKGRLGRWIYLGLLATLLLYIMDVWIGQLFYMKAEGMVMRDSATLATEYVARVLSISVKEGDQVSKGQVIGQMQSQDIANQIAKMTTDIANTQLAITAMQVKQQSLEGSLPAARARAEEAERAKANLQGMRERGLITETERARAVNDAFNTNDDLRKIESELSVINRELPPLLETLENARNNVRQLQASYAGGAITSPADGTVHDRLAEPGTVLRVGDSIVRITYDEVYVLAYVPTGALYTLKPGDRLSLITGFHLLDGQIRDILPLAPKLPSEFQKTFQVAQHQQLLRISLDKGQEMPPLFSTLSIHWTLSPRVVILRGLRAIGGLFQDRTTGQPNDADRKG